MYFRHEISVLCILVIVFQIKQCRSAEGTKNVKVKTKSTNVDSDAFKNLPPPPEGYHYEYMSQVVKKHKPGSYKLVTLETAKQITKKKKTITKVQRVENNERGNEEHDSGDHENDDGKQGNDNDDNKGDHDNDDNKGDHDNDDNKEDKGNEEENSEHGEESVRGVHDEESHKEDTGNDDENPKHGDDDGRDDQGEESHKEDKGNDDENPKHDDDGGKDDQGKESHNKDKENDDEHSEHGDAGGRDDQVEESHKENKGNDDENPEHGDAGDKDDSDKGSHKKDRVLEEDDPADILDGGMIEAMEESAKDGYHGDNKKRKKRGFSFKLPFMSSGEDSTETVVTAKAVTTTTTNPVTNSTDATTTVTATAVATGDKSDSSSEEEVTEVTAVATTTNSSFMGGFQSGMLRIVAYGNDMKASLVGAAPYLPMVWKVAVFIVPGLSQYEMLMMAVDVATITAEVLKRHDSGESWSSVLTDVAKNELWKSILSKRDDGFSIGDYASNVYETVKTHLGYIPKYFSGDKSSSSVTVTLGETTNNIEKVETEVTTINSEIPGTGVTVTENEEKQLESNKMTENLKKKIMDMKNHVHHSSEGSMSGSDGNDDDDGDDDADDDIDDDSDEEININAGNIKLDKTLFDQVLESSMKLQPDFIQKMSGEELVEYLNNMKIQSVVDSKPVFDALTSNMGIDDRVTNEQKNKLVDILSKITDYFIAKGLEAKQYINSVID